MLTSSRWCVRLHTWLLKHYFSQVVINPILDKGISNAWGAGKRRQLFRSKLLKEKLSLNPQNQAKTFHYALLFGWITGTGGGSFSPLAFPHLLKEMQQGYTVRQVEWTCPYVRKPAVQLVYNGLCFPFFTFLLLHDFIYEFRDSGI